jgi:hypothetical protein
MRKHELIWRATSRAIRLATVVLLMTACGGEPDSSELDSDAELAASQEEHTPEERRHLDVTIRLEEMRSEAPESLARFKGALPRVAGTRQAQLRAEIEALAALLAELEQLDQAWEGADDRQRDALAPQIEAILDQAGAALVQAEHLLGSERR